MTEDAASSGGAGGSLPPPPPPPSSAPTGQAGVVTTPADTRPAGTTPADSAPADSAPADSAPGGTEQEAAALRAIPVRHPGRWVAAAIIGLLLAMLVHSLVANPNWQWGVVRQYLFSSRVLKGVGLTLELTALAMLIGVVGGGIIAVMRLSPNPLISGVAWIYTWFFRGTPVLVQIIFWSFIGALYRFPSIGLPFGHAFVTYDANKLIPVFVGALLGLGLNEAAYMAEIVRAGILSVDHGQTEAAQALGMKRLTVMRRIVLPQAMRVIIPPTGNETISMLKTTSLVSVIAVADLFTTVQLIYGSNYKQIPLLAVASLWYLAMTSVLSVGQYYLERRFGRGSARALPPTPLQRMRWRLLGMQVDGSGRRTAAAGRRAGGAAR